MVGALASDGARVIRQLADFAAQSKRLNTSVLAKYAI
jgi:hypothetical protein